MRGLVRLIRSLLIRSPHLPHPLLMSKKTWSDTGWGPMPKRLHCLLMHCRSKAMRALLVLTAMLQGQHKPQARWCLCLVLHCQLLPDRSISAEVGWAAAELPAPSCCSWHPGPVSLLVSSPSLPACAPHASCMHRHKGSHVGPGKHQRLGPALA